MKDIWSFSKVNNQANFNTDPDTGKLDPIFKSSNGEFAVFVVEWPSPVIIITFYKDGKVVDVQAQRIKPCQI